MKKNKKLVTKDFENLACDREYSIAEILEIENFALEKGFQNIRIVFQHIWDDANVFFRGERLETDEEFNQRLKYEASQEEY